MNIYNFIESNINKNSIFFEIGSHFGSDTQKFSKITNKLHCFEPDPRNIKIFKHLNSNVQLNEFAISDKDGVSQFFLSSGNVYESMYGPTENELINQNDWSASSSLISPKNHFKKTPWVKFDNTIEVKTKRLDTYCIENDINNIDFLWMDVQGAELSVIKSMGAFKDKIHYIYTEYSNEELYENQGTKEQIIELLGNSWKVLCDFGGDILLENQNYDINYNTSI
jgi:FkbM family methyltransferase